MCYPLSCLNPGELFSFSWTWLSIFWLIIFSFSFFFPFGKILKANICTRLFPIHSWHESVMIKSCQELCCLNWHDFSIFYHICAVVSFFFLIDFTFLRFYIFYGTLFQLSLQNCDKWILIGTTSWNCIYYNVFFQAWGFFKPSVHVSVHLKNESIRQSVIAECFPSSERLS